MDRQPTFQQSLIILGAVFALILPAMFIWKAEPHIPLLLAVVISATLLRWSGINWKKMEEGIVGGIQSAVVPMMILSLIGILIGVWMMSGTVPTILAYGIDLLSPNHFALSTLLLTIVVSSLTGSSFTTVSTVGVALTGIAAAMGLDPLITAGAVICGACFGDKMSPLSDTTNFASAVAGADLTAHVRYMTRTTLPALGITLLFFGWKDSSPAADLAAIAAVKEELSAHFTLHWVTLLSPLTVLYCSLKRKPLLPTLTLGILTGLLTAVFIQQETSPARWLQVMQHGFDESFVNQTVASIVNRGGLQSMTWSLSLILIALALGGLLQHCGVFHSLFYTLLRSIKSNGQVVRLAGSSSILVNALTGEQYLSILLPGQMFREEFERRGMANKLLSRTLEDCGTLVNPLVPWGVSGAFFASTLQVPAAGYIPYAIFLWLSPLLTFAYSYRRK
ncbi:Na+/H+ antiporter NhaC [Brevibacillus sp. H7]|uniref:Na+/H+ antiporter NhaC n=1 Tax=Brevibacillus sp. H7 TaxID=3349138 RepID=UPI0037FA8DCB